MRAAPAPSCYGCIYLRYRGPIGILPDEEIEPKDMGTYHCRLFSESRGDANLIPRPILSACKETQ